MLRLILLVLVLAPMASAQQVYMSYRNYDFQTSGTDYILVRSDSLAKAIVAEEFAAVNRPVPVETGENGTRPIVMVDARTFEIHSLRVEPDYVYTQVSEGFVPDSTSPNPGELFDFWETVPDRLDGPSTDRVDQLRLATRSVISRLGWTPVDPPVPPADSFYVYGANPNTSGTLRMHLPPNWSGTWVDALGRVVSESDEITSVSSGVYFAVGMNRTTRVRQVRKMTVIR